MGAIEQDWGTANARTLMSTELDSLADAAGADGPAIDFGDPAPFAVAFEAKITATAGATARLFLYMKWSNDNTDFSDTENTTLVGSIDLNATSQVIKIDQFPVLARYGKMRAENQSGAALAADAGDILGTDVLVNAA